VTSRTEYSRRVSAAAAAAAAEAVGVSEREAVSDSRYQKQALHCISIDFALALRPTGCNALTKMCPLNILLVV